MQTRKIVLGILLCCVFSDLLHTVWGQQQEQVRAIVGGTLIDGTGQAPKQNLTIVIRHVRIEKIVPSESFTPTEQDRVIRADGKYIVPGFIDAHVHYRDYYPELLINHGITSVADWGGSPLAWILAQRDGVNSGELFGPRIFTCGESFSQRPEDQTEEYAQKWLRKMLSSGVDKIDIGYPTPPEVLRVLIEGGHRAGLPVSGYPSYAQEAIALGIDAIKHTYMVGILSQKDAQLLDEIHRQALLPYRKRDLELPLVGPDNQSVARKLVEKKVYWIPTLVKDFKVIHDRREEFEIESMRFLSNPNLDYLPREDMFLMSTNQFAIGIPTPGGFHFKGLAKRRFDRIKYDATAFDRYHDAYKNLQSLIRGIVRGGGWVLAGTAPHSYVLPGLSLHQEMQLFVDAGLTPMEALQSASLWVARYLRQDRHLGTIEEGKLADMVILEKNPLQDIHNTRTIHRVIQGGRVMSLGYHFAYKNPIPRNTRTTAPGAASPTPQLKSLSAETLMRQAEATELILYGDWFTEGAVVYLDEIPLETRFISRQELGAVIPARLLRDIGTHWIQVVNPPPGRSTSEPLSLIVRY